ncbi:MAG TPA: TIGR00730 family Rossman fold protein, partial [Sedimenticola thiotaurini]|nr:TIGR00730 family Rossman fold protein [Sedimenticola thiotaurini]
MTDKSGFSAAAPANGQLTRESWKVFQIMSEFV